MTRRQKKELLRIGAGAILFAVAWLLPLEGWWRFAAFLIPYFTVGWDVLWKAVRHIAHGSVFDENFLMAVATIGAMAIGEYPEGVAVMLFYQVGEWFQRYAVGRSRRSVAALMDIRPDTANVEREGETVEVSPDEVAVGEVIVIKPGERVPLDGVVLQGSSSLDTAALTGEPIPRDVAAGDEVISGCVNGGGLLRVRVSKPFGESTVSRILDLVENAADKKAPVENFITRFARVYTPCVVVGAAILAVLPPLLTGNGWSEWIHRALLFLVISCPCALVISVPLSYFGGIGGASRAGILVKGGNYLDALAAVDTVVMDKTGTLTEGVFSVTAVHPASVGKDRLVELAALAESYSDHPIARSLRAAYDCPVDASRVSDVREVAGRGVSAVVDGLTVRAGNDALMAEEGIAPHPCHRVGTIVHVSVNGEYAGHIVIYDALKPDARQAVAALKELGVRRAVMLTGDADAVGEQVAAELGLDEVYARLLPDDKVRRLETLLQDNKGRLAFVGDGINDAPVLARADVGIAMGAMGADAAIEAADVVLMDDRPSKIALAIGIARRTRRIARQNVAFALAVKAAVLILGALGLANMWEAVFADVGVAVLAILNAMRALRVKNY